jgi:hypothetical protein
MKFHQVLRMLEMKTIWNAKTCNMKKKNTGEPTDRRNQKFSRKSALFVFIQCLAQRSSDNIYSLGSMKKTQGHFIVTSDQSYSHETTEQ